MPARGEVRDTLRLGLLAGSATTRQLAMSTGVGVTKAMYTLRDMVVAGEVAVVDRVRVPGVKRPVPLYDLADAEPAGDGMNWDLVTCWAQWPGQA